MNNAQTTKKEDIFKENEIEANKLVAFSMILQCVILAIGYLLCYIDVFKIDDYAFFKIAIQSIVELLIAIVLCHIMKGEKKWLKYVMFAELTIVLARLDCSLNYTFVLAMVIPVVLSCRYFDTKFTIIVAIFSALLFAISTFANAYFDIGLFDLNFYTLPINSTLNITSTLEEAIRSLGIDVNKRVYEAMVLNYIPKLILLALISVICFRIAKTGHNMVIKQKNITKKSMRIESELNLANNIQAHMLPNIFPPFPDHKELDIYASMIPAKEVGGDFYDFYMIDEKHLCLTIADVSGKGIPAALFMVIAKTILKNEINMGTSPADTFTKANHMLSEGNDNAMFVTAWLGIINLETGVLTYVNAGHNPPLIKHNGKFEFLKSKAGFILAGIDGMRYSQCEIKLDPSDKIFLYTDGVTEACNHNNEQYGEERLQNYLNEHSNDASEHIVYGIKEEVDKFVNSAEQFDDITMVMVHYKRAYVSKEYKELKLHVPEDKIDKVNSFVESELEVHNASMKFTNQILLCIEEIYINIYSYAYKDGGQVTLKMISEDNEITLQFIDSGIPFNPLENKDPDIKLKAEERKAGGLGIFLVKKIMDDVSYEYANGQNILTMRKKYE